MLFFLFLIGTVLCIIGDDSVYQLTDRSWQKAKGGMNKRFNLSVIIRFIDDNQVNVAHQSCVQPNGQAGHCRPRRHCLQEGSRNDVINFLDNACITNQQTIGACCPDEATLIGAQSLAGDLPAVVPKEEPNEAITKVTRAESRGCGLSTRPQSRVLGARQANPREWPWMASVTPEGFEQYCGGVLITDRHVMTAAHCTRRCKAEKLFVRLGEYDFSRIDDSRTYNFRVTEIRQHEHFQFANYKNDITILKLDRPAIFNSYVWPICLPPTNLELTDELLVVIGWGSQKYNGSHSKVLRELTVPVWNHDKCVAAFSDSIFDETLCAAGKEGGKDACQGDSGGPLMYQMPSGRWTVVGLVSWGLRCGEANHPGLYLRVDKYLRWIAQNTRF